MLVLVWLSPHYRYPSYTISLLSRLSPILGFVYIWALRYELLALFFGPYEKLPAQRTHQYVFHKISVYSLILSLLRLFLIYSMLLHWTELLYFSIIHIVYRCVENHQFEKFVDRNIEPAVLKTGNEKEKRSEEATTKVYGLSISHPLNRIGRSRQ